MAGLWLILTGKLEVIEMVTISSIEDAMEYEKELRRDKLLRGLAQAPTDVIEWLVKMLSDELEKRKIGA